MCFLKSFITDQMDSAIFDCNRACNSVRNYISLVLTPFAYCLRSRWPFWVLTWTRFFRNPDWTLFIILRSLIYWVSEFSCFRANSYKLGLLLWEQMDCGDTVSSSVSEPKSCFSSKTLGRQLGLFLLGYFIITYCQKVTIIFCSAMHGIHSSHPKILKRFLKKPQGPIHFSLLEYKCLVFFEAYNIVNSPPMQSKTLIVAAVLWYEWLKLFSRDRYEQNTFRIVKLFLISFFLCKFLNRLHFLCVEFHYFLNVLATCFILFKQVLSQSRESCLICLVIWIQKFWLTFPEGFVIIFF